MEEFIASFQTSKLAEEKGYDLRCFKQYHRETEERIYTSDDLDVNLGTHWKLAFARDGGLLAPSLSRLQAWFRNKRQTIVTVDMNADRKLCCIIHTPKDTLIFGSFDIWEDALEAALYKALTLLK